MKFCIEKGEPISQKDSLQSGAPVVLIHLGTLFWQRVVLICVRPSGDRSGEMSRIMGNYAENVAGWCSGIYMWYNEESSTFDFARPT